MKVAIIYNEPVSGAPDSEDVMSQVALVAGAMKELGYDYITFGIDYFPAIFSMLDEVSYLINKLERFGGSVIFNLVEAVGKNQRLASVVAGLFELIEAPYTGSPFEAILITTNKVLTKAILRAEGIRTPEWCVYKNGSSPEVLRFPVLLKPALEDASVGIDEDSLVYERDLLVEVLKRMSSIYKQPILIEEFIDGREFNVSLLEHPDGSVEVLPVAEMVFQDWPEGKPKIVGYRAKWDGDSFEAKNTVRRFEPEDAPLRKIREIALKCWKVFGLSGYARVDMRMDTEGEIHVIEINANPCISPDAGFVAACLEAGYEVTEVVEKIIHSAIRRYHTPCRKW